jgi:chaperonin GroEL
MGKQIFYGDDARNRILKGMEILETAVRSTYGPKAGNAIIGNGYNPTITHDGVTVAEAVQFTPKTAEELGFAEGVELIRSAAQNLNHLAGDGTTTVTILTYEIFKAANRLIAAGSNPQTLRKELEDAAEEVVVLLADLAEEIDVDSKRDRIQEIATISAGDPEIGKLISKVMREIGPDGVVSVETTQSSETSHSIVKGFEISQGYISPFFITDPKRDEAILQNPDILITDKRIANIMDILPFMQKMTQANRKDLVIIADDVAGDALSTFILNNRQQSFNTIIIKAPEFGERRSAILEDIAILTGGRFISDASGETFDKLELDVLGRARRVRSGRNVTAIIDGRGDAQAVQDRISEINNQLEGATGYAEILFKKRAASLSGKVAVIHVGGNTETAIDEKKYRVDDAVAAAKAALDEGIVPGGGVTLVNLAAQLKGDSDGVRIIRQAFYRPFLILMENAGQNGDSLFGEVFKNTGMGYNVDDPTKLIDVKKSGVIDPVRVTREAIQNAVSIAATAATMGPLIVDDLPDESN